MTAGNSGNGAGPPEGDDPFAYLYRSEDGQGGQGRDGYGTSTEQPGVPRTSYNQVRAVGERSYAGQQAPAAFARQGQRQEPNPHYAAPAPPPGGRAAARNQGADGHGRGARRNGPLIAALAVVLAVIVGVGAAILLSDGDSENTGSGADPSASAADDAGSQQRDDERNGGRDRQRQPELPSADAATFRLGGAPVVAADVPGAEAENGTYVAMNKPDASATWITDVKQAGSYRLYVRYGVPGKDMNLNLYVNDERQPRPLNMGNFANAGEGDWEHGWTQTWGKVVLTEGSNAIKIACEAGNACEVNLDRVWLAPSS